MAQRVKPLQLAATQRLQNQRLQPALSATQTTTFCALHQSKPDCLDPAMSTQDSLYIAT